ncbi:EMC1_C domain-containing protein [Meloidogyne graminicola]|uniref:ER membrane protein complex subunit 1 n=1 Tax=Meloidogyne graminicola TaxID=189291 RepID=A0A8S9ZXC3_9BILA|nr:EMC1_C domain-containing protein [Meloidogyne graminicola]
MKGNLYFNYILLIFPFLCSAIYLDQVGKFDWYTNFYLRYIQFHHYRQKLYLGCPQQSWFERVGTREILIIISNLNVVGAISVENGDILWRRLNDKNIVFHGINGSSVIIKSDQRHLAFDLHTGVFLWENSVEQIDLIYKQQSRENGLLDTHFYWEIGDLEIQSENIRFRLQNDNSTASVKEIKILVERVDCSLSLFEFTQTNQSLKQIWVRHESLAMISDVLMVDLPLSESQTQIESEFNQNESVLQSFLLRIRSQLGQLHRFFLKTSESIAETINAVIQGKLRFSVVIKQLFSQIDRSTDGPFERDYFNMRKMIVVSTLAGTLHGLDSGSGRLIWTYFFGTKFSAYKKSKIPLFLLRGTSFYQWGSQAAVVFNFKISGGIFRVEICPFVSSEQLHSLIILRNNNLNKVEFLPIIKNKNIAITKPIFISMINETSGILTGNEINLDKDGLVVERWQTTLPGFGTPAKEVIELIIGKDFNEKVHSQGRVLGDRSVLYKYSNPNLIGILSSNPSESLLRINLFDSVSGLLVYSGRYTKANPPFHMIHCENWVLISYWNDKARRTEIGVIELFEGLQQMNSSAFNSLSATARPPMVLKQAYIFPQGISTISTTQTVQGLTSRSILIALPSGGILEISRRFLDARRPLEMLLEHREEMLIPYIPELPLSTEDFINYNQTVMKVRQIRSAPSGLESSSLIFVFGLDLFYTRVMPSGTFDILKDDFDYAFIFLVMVFLTVTSYICKRISRHQGIQKAWE